MENEKAEKRKREDSRKTAAFLLTNAAQKTMITATKPKAITGSSRQSARVSLSICCMRAAQSTVRCPHAIFFHSTGRLPFRGAALLSFSEFCISDSPGVQFHIPDVAHAGEVHHHALKAEAEARVAHRAVAPQVKAPRAVPAPPCASAANRDAPRAATRR